MSGEAGEELDTRRPGGKGAVLAYACENAVIFRANK